MPSFFKSKDKRNRHLVSKNETSRAVLQYFLRASAISLAQKQRLVISTSTKVLKSLKFTVKSRNRCVITGRAGSVFRYFRLSRITLKQFASRGFLTGIRKSSW